MIQIRASSISELLDCSRRWESKHVLRIQYPRSAAAHIGTSIHAGTAIYDASWQSEDAIEAANEAAIRELENPTEEVDWGDMPDKERVQRVLTGMSAYIDNVKREYTEIELALEPIMVDVAGTEIMLTGTTDRVRLSEGKIGITDIKTSARTQTGARAAPQLGIYQFMTETYLGMEMDLPAEIIGINTSKGTVTITEIPRAKEIVLGTPDQPGLLEGAASILRSGMFPPNPSSMMCSVKYCPIYATCGAHA
jgi:hypothetical protein